MISDGTYRDCACCSILFAEGDVRGRTMCSLCTAAGCLEGGLCLQSASLTGKIQQLKDKVIQETWRDRPPLL